MQSKGLGCHVEKMYNERQGGGDDVARVITKITRQRNEERYNIYLDEKYAFSVDEAIIIQYGLTKGSLLMRWRLERLPSMMKYQEPIIGPYLFSVSNA